MVDDSTVENEKAVIASPTLLDSAGVVNEGNMTDKRQHFFDLAQVAAVLPVSSEKMLEDIRMAEERAASCRVVRMYRQLPLHFHRTSDENVYVFSGRAIFQLGEERREIASGMFIQFPKGMPHAVLDILEEPLLTLTVDTPCRPEDDITFVDPTHPVAIPSGRSDSV